MIPMMINKEQVLALTDQGLNIFSHYLGFEVNLHRNFRSPFYDEQASFLSYLLRQEIVDL